MLLSLIGKNLFQTDLETRWKKDKEIQVDVPQSKQMASLKIQNRILHHSLLLEQGKLPYQNAADNRFTWMRSNPQKFKYFTGKVPIL